MATYTMVRYQFWMNFILQLMLLVAMGAAQLHIETSAGAVQGFLRQVGDHDYRAFLGIPYAEKPERFKPPLPKSSWNDTLGVLDATNYGPSCPQDIDRIDEIYDGRKYLFTIPAGSAREISEDCLTLNVFTPDAANGANNPLAVMVWIHGGDFEVGQGAAYDGAVLATHGRVVVVTINYRLGPFGFLSTLDQNSPGNYAFLDQQLALKWVQKDIGAFGGDPTRVTLFGQSTGGLSTSLHMFAPESQGLFHRAIAESSVITPWNLDEGFREPLSLARQFGIHAGCSAGHNRPLTNNKRLVDCLSRSSVDNLLRGWRMTKKHPWRTTWSPVIDGEFLPVVKQNFADAAYFVTDHDIMVGVTSREGSLKEILEVAGISETDLVDGLSKESWTTLLHSILEDFSDHQRFLVSASINQLYTDWNLYDDDMSRLQQALYLIGDMSSVLRQHEFLTSWTAGDVMSSVFTYVFDHKTNNYSNSAMLLGAPRSEDLPYVWGAPFNDELMRYFTQHEKSLSATIMTYWTNFAKTGDPNLEDQPSGNVLNNLPKWPDYDHSDDMAYLRISIVTDNESPSSSLSLSPQQRYRWQQVFYWTETLPNLLAETTTCRPVASTSDEDTNGTCTTTARIGQDSGWNLTPEEALLTLRVLLGVSLFLVCVVFMLIAAVCGYREAVRIARYGHAKGKWGYLSAEQSAEPSRRTEPERVTAGEHVNHGYIPNDSEDASTHL